MYQYIVCYFPMDTQPFYLRLLVLRSSPQSHKHGFDEILYSTSRCNFYEYSCITKMPSHKKLYTVWFQFWLLAVFVVAVVLHLHLCVGVFSGMGLFWSVLVRIKSKYYKIEYYFWNLFKFSLMQYEFMARLFPQQRPLIHFWTDVKKSVGQKWIYFGLAHQVVQEFRYRRFRVINRTLYTYFSICFYLCLITLEWIWNKSPGNRDLCHSLRNLIKHAIYFKRHL